MFRVQCGDGSLGFFNSLPHPPRLKLIKPLGMGWAGLDQKIMVTCGGFHPTLSRMSPFKRWRSLWKTMALTKRLYNLPWSFGMWDLKKSAGTKNVPTWIWMAVVVLQDVWGLLTKTFLYQKAYHIIQPQSRWLNFVESYSRIQSKWLSHPVERFCLQQKPWTATKKVFSY